MPEILRTFTMNPAIELQVALEAEGIACHISEDALAGLGKAFAVVVDDEADMERAEQVRKEFEAAT